MELDNQKKQGLEEIINLHQNPKFEKKLGSFLYGAVAGGYPGFIFGGAIGTVIAADPIKNEEVYLACLIVGTIGGAVVGAVGNYLLEKSLYKKV
ncbi:hypothetical protein HZB00_04070 [Candidatus Woesearchaeota archaeon]|nr:hypothetical protein [Candidatus Woesearchaeota archaeon]